MTHQTPDFDTIKTGKFTRKFNIHESEVRLNSKDDRTVDLSFSSEAPYERWFGIEVLDHSPESVRMDWFKGGTAPLLLDHDSRQQIGVIETAAIGSDRVGRATVRFSKSALADSVLCDIRDGIRRNVSVGYRIHKMRMEESADDGESYRVTDWSPLEASIVAVPADQNVGVGRDDKGETFTTQIIRSSAIPASSGKEYQVNIHVNKDEIQRAERDRAASISAIGARHNMGQIAAEHVAKGTPLDQFRGIMLDHIGETKPLEAPIAELGLSPKDQRSYSIIRAVNAVANKDWTGAGFERECSDEIGNKIGKNSRGFFMPTDIRGWDAQRDLTVGTASAGGNLKPTDHLGGSYIESLRNQMVLKGLGARVISGLRGDVAIPAANAATTHYWVGENGAPTEGAPTFRQVTMSPKPVAGYVDMSRLLLQQSDPSALMAAAQTSLTASCKPLALVPLRWVQTVLHRPGQSLLNWNWLLVRAMPLMATSDFSQMMRPGTNSGRLRKSPARIL